MRCVTWNKERQNTKCLWMGYDLIFESDQDVFSIAFYDREGAHNNLYRFEKYNSTTTIENVQFAIYRLRKVLGKNEFCLYINRNDKIYQKQNGQYQRIKDWKELVTVQK